MKNFQIVLACVLYMVIGWSIRGFVYPTTYIYRQVPSDITDFNMMKITEPRYNRPGIFFKQMLKEQCNVDLDDNAELYRLWRKDGKNHNMAVMQSSDDGALYFAKWD